MPSLREYDVKIASLKNTRKMTKTMQMVSASKLRRAQDAQRKAAAYANHLHDLIQRLAGSVESVAHPLLTRRDSVRKAHILLVTSDRGLCAGFNNNLIKHVAQWISEHNSDYESISMSCCGRRGNMYFRTKEDVRKEYPDATAKPEFLKAEEIAEELGELFVNGEFDEVYLAYNVFKSALSQYPLIEKILPIAPVEIKADESKEPFTRNYIFEPAEPELLALLLPRSVSYTIFHAMVENSAGEHGARMTAMDNATNNADSLIETNTLLRNRARQAAITTELTEIVAGAEAL